MPIQDKHTVNRQHAVPQNIMDVEFKIIGDLTMRQFFYLLVFGAFAYGSFTLSGGVLKWPLTLTFALAGVGLAFVPIEERGLDEWVVNFIRAVFSSNQKVWRKRPETLSAFVYQNMDVVKQELITLTPTSSRRKLEEFLEVKLKKPEKDPLDIDEKEYIKMVREAFYQAPEQQESSQVQVVAPPIARPFQTSPVSTQQQQMPKFPESQEPPELPETPEQIEPTKQPEPFEESAPEKKVEPRPESEDADYEKKPDDEVKEPKLSPQETPTTQSQRAEPKQQTVQEPPKQLPQTQKLPETSASQQPPQQPPQQIPESPEPSPTPANQIEIHQVERTEPEVSKPKYDLDSAPADLHEQPEKPRSAIQTPPKNEEPKQLAGETVLQEQILSPRRREEPEIKKTEIQLPKQDYDPLEPITPDQHSGRMFTSFLPKQGEIILPIRGERVLSTLEEKSIEEDIEKKTQQLKQLMDQIRQGRNIPYQEQKQQVQEVPLPIKKKVKKDAPEKREEIKIIKEGENKESPEIEVTSVTEESGWSGGLPQQTKVLEPSTPIPMSLPTPEIERAVIRETPPEVEKQLRKLQQENADLSRQIKDLKREIKKGGDSKETDQKIQTLQRLEDEQVETQKSYSSIISSLEEVKEKVIPKKEEQRPLPKDQDAPGVSGVKPNVIAGNVTDQQGSALEGIVLIIKNSKGEPVRALKTDAIGHFAISTPLAPDTYTIETDKSKKTSLSFDIITLEAKNEVIPSVKIIGKT
jgi:hypothetical protein